LGSGEFPLHQLARKYGVNYIVSGHGHQFVRLSRDGIVYHGGGQFRGPDEWRGIRAGLVLPPRLGPCEAVEGRAIGKGTGRPAGKGRMFRGEDWGDNGPKFAVGDPASTKKPKT